MDPQLIDVIITFIYDTPWIALVFLMSYAIVYRCDCGGGGNDE